MVNLDPNSKINIDKNMAYNVMELRRDEDTMTEKIIKSLLIYFSLSYQEDLWGYRTLDPHEFAKTMRFSTANLFRKHPAPEYLKYAKRTSINWESYLENALFILFTKPIFQEYKTFTDEFESTKMTNFIILEEIDLIRKKVGVRNNKKHYYKYRLNDSFERNVRRFFLQTRINLYIDCEEKNISDFYLYITNIYNNNKRKEPKYYFTLNSLSDFFKITPDLEPRKRKNKINKYFRTAENLLANEIPGLKFDWAKQGNSRWYYTPFMTWTQLSEHIIKKNDEAVMNITFLKSLRRSLYDLYTTQYTGLPDEESFFYWLINEKDMNFKISAYVQTLATHQKIPNYPTPETLAKSFFRIVKECKTLQGVKDLFSPKI